MGSHCVVLCSVRVGAIGPSQDCYKMCIECVLQDCYGGEDV